MWTGKTQTRDTLKNMVCTLKNIAISATFVLFGFIFFTPNAFAAVTWTDQTGSGTKSWSNVAMSADGTTLIAAVPDGHIWTSTNSGVSWTDQSSVACCGYSVKVAISADGTKMIAVSTTTVAFSSNSGSSWAIRALPSEGEWVTAIAGDGSKIVIAEPFSSAVYVSSNDGVSWADRNTGASPILWNIAMSYDGATLLTGYGGAQTKILTSTNSGTSWTTVNVSATGWYDFAMSRDATKMVAVINGGYIYTSQDSGATWAQQTGSGSRNWVAVESSDDGVNLAAAVSTGQIYLSTDGGVTWTAQSSPGSRAWNGLSAPGSGSKVAASASGVDIWTMAASAPAISSVAVATTSSTATVTWTTDSNSSSKVSFGLTSSYGTTTSQTDTATSTRTTSHSTVVSGLVSCATYHYAVSSVDSYALSATSTDATFTTAGCTSDASVATTTSSAITTASGGTLSFSTTTITVPTSFTSSASSATFQASQLNGTTFFASVAEPTGVDRVGDYVVTLRALSDATTTISSFDQPITVTMSYQAADVTSLDTSTLKIYRYNGSAWSELSSCTVDTGARTVSCTTTQFSDFAIFGSAPAAASSSSSSSSSTGGNGPIFAGTAADLPGYIAPRQQIVYPDGRVVYLDLDTIVASQATSTSVTLPFVFTKNRRLYEKGDDIQKLQQYLNAHGFLVSASGPGSLGKETTLFGPATYRALIKFQKANNLPQTGFFGPMTRGVIEKNKTSR